jgi:hypothetical protein
MKKLGITRMSRTPSAGLLTAVRRWRWKSRAMSWRKIKMEEVRREGGGRNYQRESICPSSLT